MLHASGDFFQFLDQIFHRAYMPTNVFVPHQNIFDGLLVLFSNSHDRIFVRRL